MYVPDGKWESRCQVNRQGFKFKFSLPGGQKELILPRILDILILQDKTLFCACVDNFKQNGGFWRYCACADNFKQNGVFLRQHLPVVRV